MQCDSAAGGGQGGVADCSLGHLLAHPTLVGGNLGNNVAIGRGEAGLPLVSR